MTATHLELIEHLDFTPAIACEYSLHGVLGPAGEPARYYILAGCPSCGGPPRVRTRCLSCWYGARFIHCKGCGLGPYPRGMFWTILREIGDRS